MIEQNLQLEWMDPKLLPENPLNWRSHPKRQRQHFQALFDAVGWAACILYNKRTNRIVDGHLRRQEAIDMKLQQVPVLIVDWSEEQEQQALLGLDSIGAMAKLDYQALKSLSAGFEERKKALVLKDPKSLKQLSELNTDLLTLANKIETKKASAVLLQQSITTRSKRTKSKVGIDEVDIIFTSSNVYGIPDLLPTKLLPPEKLPRVVYDRNDSKFDVMAFKWYCESCRPFDKDRKGGILGFFTEDWRFNKVYEKPAMWLHKLIEDKWDGVVQPDFSLYDDWPFPMNLWNFYRSRWVARFWQENGLYVLPIMQVCNLPDNPIDPTFRGSKLGLETLPSKIPCFASECRTLAHNKGNFEVWGNLMREWVERLKPEAVVIYGGKDHQSKFWGYLPHNKGVDYILLPSYISKRRR